MAKQLDESEFRAHYERYSGPLFRFIYRFTNNQEAAEEILHDIFIKLLAGDFREGPDCSLKAWLYTLAKNRCINVLKKQSHEVKNAHAVDAAAADFDLEEQTFNKNAFAQLRLAEKTLPADLQATWELRKQGLDYQEISQALSVPVGTVKSRFSRLVDYLRKEIANER